MYKSVYNSLAKNFMQQLTVLGDTGPEEANILHSGSEMIRRQGSIKIGNS